MDSMACCARTATPTVVPEGAFFVVEGADDKVRVNWDLAGDCDEACVSLCPPGALSMYGKRMYVVYELDDYKTPSDELVQQLQAIIDEAFGRSGQTAPGAK